MEAPEKGIIPPSKEDLAAYDFKTLLPKFEKVTDTLSNFQLKRVTAALMEYPLMASEKHFSYPQERELYSLGCKIIDCKSVLITALMNMTKEELETLSKELNPNVSVQSVVSDSGSKEIPGEPDGSTVVVTS